MHLDVEIILELTTEQQECTCIWPHPWEHYPFQVDGERKWKRYLDLEAEQKNMISDTLALFIQASSG